MFLNIWSLKHVKTLLIVWSAPIIAESWHGNFNLRQDQSSWIWAQCLSPCPRCWAIRGRHVECPPITTQESNMAMDNPLDLVSLYGIILPIDEYFSEGLKPPTSPRFSWPYLRWPGIGNSRNAGCWIKMAGWQIKAGCVAVNMPVNPMCLCVSV